MVRVRQLPQNNNNNAVLSGAQCVVVCVINASCLFPPFLCAVRAREATQQKNTNAGCQSLSL